MMPHRTGKRISVRRSITRRLLGPCRFLSKPVLSNSPPPRPKMKSGNLCGMPNLPPPLPWIRPCFHLLLMSMSSVVYGLKIVWCRYVHTMYRVRVLIRTLELSNGGEIKTTKGAYVHGPSVTPCYCPGGPRTRTKLSLPRVGTPWKPKSRNTSKKAVYTPLHQHINFYYSDIIMLKLNTMVIAMKEGMDTCFFGLFYKMFI